MDKRNDVVFVGCLIVIELMMIFLMGMYMYWDLKNMYVAQAKTEIVEEVEDDIFIEPETIEEPVVELEPEPVVTYFDIPLDESLQDHIFAECARYDVDPAVVVAMIQRESGFRESVVGDSGRSFGLMQIQKKWHSGRMEKLGCDDLLDPYQNVTVGIDFLAELIGSGKGVEWALMAYNGGPGYANRLAGEGRVSDYAASVMASAARI